MKILLVEDDKFKENLIVCELYKLPGSHEIVVAKSVASAVGKLSTGSFDLIVLDVSLPSHDRSSAASSLQMPSGGLEILYELAYEERLSPVIIITQYPEIELESKRALPIKSAHKVLADATGAKILDVIHFDKAGEEWKRQLAEALQSDG